MSCSVRLGAYLSLVERVVWDHEVAGSTPVAPLCFRRCLTVTCCEAKKPAVVTSARARIATNGCAETMPASQKQRSMACRGSWFTAKSFQRVAKQQPENDITKPAVVAMNLAHSYRAVAAATGRRFKSCRPDFLACESAFATSAATTIRVARASRENEL